MWTVSSVADCSNLSGSPQSLTTLVTVNSSASSTHVSSASRRAVRETVVSPSNDF